MHGSVNVRIFEGLHLLLRTFLLIPLGLQAGVLVLFCVYIYMIVRIELLWLKSSVRAYTTVYLIMTGIGDTNTYLHG